jgi:hypothetical protein
MVLGFALVEFWYANVAKLPNPAPNPKTNVFICVSMLGIDVLLFVLCGVKCTVPDIDSELVGMANKRIAIINPVEIIIFHRISIFAFPC